MPTYLSLGAFYASDRRRDISQERDYGLWWRGDGFRAPTFRAAWVAETGELYVMQHEGTPGGGRVDVIGRFADDVEVDAVLSGWQDVCGEPGSLRWLLERVSAPAPIPAHLARAAGIEAAEPRPVPPPAPALGADVA
jgi:hypothetical protein